MKFTFNMDLKDVGLSIRVHNSLMRAGIEGVANLRQMVSDPDDMSLCEVRNFGTQSLDEVRDFLYPDRLGKTYKVCLSDKGEDLAALIEADYVDGPVEGKQWDIWGTLGDVMMELDGQGEEGFWWPHIYLLDINRVANIVMEFMAERGYNSSSLKNAIRDYAYALFANDYIALELAEKKKWPSELLKDAPTRTASSSSSTPKS